MKLTKTKLPKEKVKQMLEVFEIWSEYEDLIFELNFLTHMWLKRTTRYNRVESNKKVLNEVDEHIEEFKKYLDGVRRDINQYQLMEID